MTTAYQRGEFLAERKAALEAWAACIAEELEVPIP